MKTLFVLFLCLSILFTGCVAQTVRVTDLREKDEGEENTEEEKIKAIGLTIIIACGIVAIAWITVCLLHPEMQCITVY